MRVFAAVDGEVLILRLIISDLDRENLRECLKMDLGSEWVWYEDEIGTLFDPIRGPNPIFGPKAPNLN